MSAEVAAPQAAGEEMEALCSELLLPSPGAVGAAGAVGSPTATAGAAPLPVSQELVLAEASSPGEGAAAEGSNVEIFIEAVAGNVTLSNAANGTGTGCGEGGMGSSVPSSGTGVSWAPFLLVSTLGMSRCRRVAEPACIRSRCCCSLRVWHTVGRTGPGSLGEGCGVALSLWEDAGGGLHSAAAPPARCSPRGILLERRPSSIASASEVLRYRPTQGAHLHSGAPPALCGSSCVAWDSQGRGRAVVLKAVIRGDIILLFLSRAGTEPPVPSSGPGESPFS